MVFAVAGVTGKTGRVVAETLLGLGHQVRVLVRSEAKGAEWAARGAEVAVVDFDVSTTLADALTGASAAYLLLPNDPTAPDFLAAHRARAERVAEAVRRSGIARLVLLSSIAAHKTSGTGPILVLNHVEALLADVPGVTFLRADYFAENLAGMVPVAQADGVLPVFHPVDLAYNMIATADIGAKAVSLLLDGGPKVVQLTGPKRSALDLAASLSTALGKPIAAVQMPLKQLVPTFTSFGIGESLAALYEEMEQAIADESLQFEPQYDVQMTGTTAESVLTAGL